MKWKNRQFGELEFDDEHVLTFPQGIIGFEDYRRFILINDEDSQPFRWLVSIEDEDLSFPCSTRSSSSRITRPAISRRKIRQSSS